MKLDNLLSFEDLEDVFAQLDGLEEVEIIDEEVIASQKRYESIIKKHKNEK